MAQDCLTCRGAVWALKRSGCAAATQIVAREGSRATSRYIGVSIACCIGIVGALDVLL
jgi:hypothetical protein